MNKVPEPLNVTEQYLHGINMRLDALCHMMSSFLEVYAKQNGIAITENQIKEEVKPRAKRTPKK